jgi:glycosidase
MERELAEIAAAQAQALAEIEARQNADQAELEAKAQAKADNAAAAVAERAAAAQAQAEADAAIAAAEADALSIPGSGPADETLAAAPAAPAEVPVDLTADATEDDVAARTRRLGANVTSIGCAFGVWAPHAEKMTLLIYGGAPDPLRGYDMSAPLPVPARYEMYRDPGNNANWRMEVQQVGAGWRYAFEVTMPGGHVFTRRDPWARETDFESDVCFVVDPKQFSFSEFKRPAHDELVMYQCHVGTFTGRGDPELGTAPGTFVALTRKLDYIKDLGFNCLQLLPHTEFGGAWGYNPRLMHAVHGPYGDSLEFAELVEAAHKRGVAVMVDVALHHGAANGNSLWEYDGWSQDDNGGIYFEKAGDTGWGQGFAFWKEEVQEYLSATMDTWLGEYNCDGVRIDSAHSMPPDFVRRVANRARQFDGRFVVVEHAPEGGHVPGELGADACWLFSNCDNCAGMTNYWKGNMERLEAVARAPEGYRANHAFVKFPLGSHDVIGKRPGHTHDLGHWASRFGGRGEWRARVHAPVVGRRRRRRRHPHAVHGHGDAPGRALARRGGGEHGLVAHRARGREVGQGGHGVRQGGERDANAPLGAHAGHRAGDTCGPRERHHRRRAALRGRRGGWQDEDEPAPDCRRERRRRAVGRGGDVRHQRRPALGRGRGRLRGDLQQPGRGFRGLAGKREQREGGHQPGGRIVAARHPQARRGGAEAGDR